MTPAEIARRERESLKAAIEKIHEVAARYGARKEEA